VVATVSRLSHKETDDDGAASSPSSIRTGPRPPPKTTAPARRSRSRRSRRSAAEPPRLAHGRTPSAPPRYRSPARVSGPSSSRRALDAGVEAPKSTAARRQRAAGRPNRSVLMTQTLPLSSGPDASEMRQARPAAAPHARAPGPTLPPADRSPIVRRRSSSPWVVLSRLTRTSRASLRPVRRDDLRGPGTWLLPGFELAQRCGGDPGSRPSRRRPRRGHGSRPASRRASRDASDHDESDLVVQERSEELNRVESNGHREARRGRRRSSGAIRASASA
jgi:hypothetical protein